MISCDTNILFIALEETRPGHSQARDFLEAHAANPSFALCELVLLELYVLLRNPITARHPLGPREAVRAIEHFRTNPRWAILDYPGPETGLMTKLWSMAAGTTFARRRVFDARLALTLRHHGVTEFATMNAKDFAGFGFARVWNPLAAT